MGLSKPAINANAPAGVSQKESRQAAKLARHDHQEARAKKRAIV